MGWKSGLGPLMPWAGGVQEILAKYRFGVAAVNPYLDFTASEESWRESVKLAQTYLDYAAALGCGRVRALTSKWAPSPPARRPSRSTGNGHPRHPGGGRRGRASGYPLRPGSPRRRWQLYDSSEATLRILKGVDRSNVIVNLQPPLRARHPWKAPTGWALTCSTSTPQLAWGWGNFDFLDSGEVDFPPTWTSARPRLRRYISIEHATYRDTLEIARHEIPYLQGLIAARNKR